MRLGTGLFAVALSVVVATAGHVATAAPILLFDSVTVTADGINPTPVQVLVRVRNPDANLDVTALSSQLTWTASGAAVTDLVSTGTVTANASGFLFTPVFDSAAFDSGSTLPLNWGVSSTGTPVTMDGNNAVTSVALLNFQIPAGVTSGSFNVSFVTGNDDFNSFADAAFEPVPYANGNNGTTLGVIGVVPEPSAAVIAAVGVVLVTGFAGLRRKGRRAGRAAGNDC